MDEIPQFSLNPYHAVTDKDRQALVALMERHSQEVEEFLTAIKARPINGIAYSKLSGPRSA